MRAAGSSYDNGGLKYLVPLWIGGCIALGAVVAVCLRLHLRLSTTGFCLFIVIVLLSLRDSFISSAIFSVVGVALLDFFFTPPLYSFRIAYTQDFFPLSAFLIASIAVTTLVRRIDRLEKVQRAQARLLDLTHDTVFVRDQHEVITYWNHAAETLYGWKQEETIGKVADELLRTRFPLPREEIQQLYIRDGHWEGELVHTKRDGSEVIVASRWTMQRDERGAPLATLETNNNITLRKRAEELLRKSQAQYLAEAQKLSRTGSFGWNVSTGEVFWSEQAFNIFEYDVAMTPTIDMVRQRVHPDDMPVFEQLLAQVVSSRSDFDVEHRLLFPDKRVKHLHVVAHRTTGQPDNRQLIGAVMDVTEAKQTEEQLRQAQHDLARASRVTALGELSASIAHEVGQPLAAIITNGEAGLRWLRRQPVNVEEVEGCLTQITDEGNRAAEIVQRVRKLMKGAPPDRALVEVNELIDEVIVLIRGEVQNQGGSLVLNLAPGLPAVLGDRVQLQQVLINIIINGVQAMASVDGERELVVGSGLDNEENVVIAVRDSGPGISKENLPRLFEAFFTTRSAGMGMGLAICSSIIEAHGGQIWASNNPEGGSSFSFSLPPAPVSAALA
ncbi:ATP-binding protein [Paraburkholderia sp. GAS334]|uniref:ATP-binding protein n=1 Tax=Paraburkholderia sp. GAS334 TaxID=3035131 RepID=UPI003D25A2ED